MSSRKTPVYVFVDLTRSGRDERVRAKILDSVRASDMADSAFVWIAVNHDDAETTSEPSWAVRVRPPAQVANLAFAGAARAGADLLILDGASMPDTPSLCALGRCLETDPHIGFAVPRIEGFKGHLIRKIDPELGDPDIDLIPRSVIDSRPPHYLMRDFTGPCLLVRAKLVREFKQLDAGFETLQGAIRDLMARARHVGFRTALVNRALVEDSEEHGIRAGSEAEARDLARLYGKYPEQGQVDEAQRRLSIHEHESLLGRAASSSPALKKSLIIDASEMGGFHNGTAESTLGILKGLHGRARGWEITLLVPPDGAQFHDLERLLPNFEFVWPAPRARYTAAFRLAQPWSIQVLWRLHRLALFNFVFMHDTILDDISLEAPAGLEQAWAFAARNADGLVYNSRYTRERMRQRFSIAPCVEERVSHLSMEPSDYASDYAGKVLEQNEAAEPYVYVVGNHFPHKWMDVTVQDLSRAFPFLRLKTLGYQNSTIPQLEGFASGNLPQQQVDDLYANARAIVLPSVYEGFGFPLVKGLSHGRTVVARQSELLEELAGIYRGPGRLVQFSSSLELVEQLGRIIHGLPLDTVPLGTRLSPNDSPPSWPDVAGRILDLIIERAAKPDSSNWERRETEFTAMQAFAAGS